MARSVDGIIRALQEYRDSLDQDLIGPAAEALQRAFDQAEIKLYAQRDLFYGLATDGDGNLQRSVENVKRAAQITDELVITIEKQLVEPGKGWTREQVGKFHQAGREMTRINLDVDYISQEMVDAVFANVSVAERAVLRVGIESNYRIMNVVGDDVTEWFRTEMLNAVVEGVPVVSKTGGDSLMNRLYQSGRLKPQTIRTADGKLIHRSLAQRAEAIARIESTRIIERTHEVLGSQALGKEAVWKNTNPQDSRTTPICAEASLQTPMSLEEWSNSRFGRPPRLSPFHLCRSHLIGGRAEWFA